MKNTHGNIDIVRNFKQEGKRMQLVKAGVSEEFAQAWCSHPNTKKEGVWFDGYVSADYYHITKPPIYAGYEMNDTNQLDK